MGWAPLDADCRRVPVPKTLERKRTLENSSKPKCDTIGCTARATHILRWRDRESGAEYTDRVCQPDGMMFTSRPALRATLEPLTA